MAYSFVQYAADGGTNQFAVPFGYISTSHVTVSVAGVDDPTYTWVNPALIQTTAAAGTLAGKTVEVRRTTPRDTRLVDFQNAANLTESMLDLSALQQFYLAQEAIDAVLNSIALDTDGAFNAQNKRIKNVADGISAQDVVTMNQLLAAAVSPVAATAAAMSFTPAGTIAASTVQAAIEELDTESQAAFAKKANNLSDLANKQTAYDNLAAALAAGTISKSADTMQFVQGGVVKKVVAENILRYEEVRQTVVAGSVDSNGQANFISAGTGLACNLAATTTPVVVSFAAGEDENGPINYRKRITADVSSAWSSLEARNRSYLYIDRDTSTGAITYGKTLIPPQAGYVFDKTKQSLLRFAGNDASTTILDDYGNTWAAAGNAQIDTAVQINGLNTLLLDGTGDYVESTNFTTLGDGGWTLEDKIRFTALPGVGTSMEVFSATNAGGYGCQLDIYNNAGTYQFRWFLSSNGTSNDITTTAQNVTLSTATDYHIAIAFDPVAGAYYSYLDGVAKHTQSNTSKVCAVAKLRLGVDGAGANGFNGAMAGFRFSPFCRYPNGTTFTPPDISTFAVEGDYFDIPSMKQYSVTSASASAGTNPGMTQKHRVYKGEAVTDGTGVTSAITYALKGRFKGAWVDTLPTSSVAISANHYIGTRDIIPKLTGECKTTDGGYTPGQRMTLHCVGLSGTTTYPIHFFSTRLAVSTSTANGTGTPFQIPPAAGGAGTALTNASWRYRFEAERGW